MSYQPPKTNVMAISKSQAAAYRQVYVMREIQQLSTLGTAECLGISPENVKVRLLRAKNKLKEELLRQTKGQEIFHFHLTRCHNLEQRVMAEIAGYDLKKLG